MRPLPFPIHSSLPSSSPHQSSKGRLLTHPARETKQVEHPHRPPRRGGHERRRVGVQSQGRDADVRSTRYLLSSVEWALHGSCRGGVDVNRTQMEGGDTLDPREKEMVHDTQGSEGSGVRKAGGKAMFPTTFYLEHIERMLNDAISLESCTPAPPTSLSRSAVEARLVPVQQPAPRFLLTSFSMSASPTVSLTFYHMT